MTTTTTTVTKTTANAGKVFSVWIDTVDGDLRCFGLETGRALSREVAWKRVLETKADGESVRQIRVYRGCTLVWSASRLSDGTWTA